MMDYEAMSQELGAYLGIGTAGVTVALLFLVAMNWMIFAKAGEPGWKAIIPYYNTYTLYKLAWGNGWLFLLQLIPAVNIVVAFICGLKLARAFGHGLGWGLGINFLPIIFYPMIAFGKSEYMGPAV